MSIKEGGEDVMPTCITFFSEGIHFRLANEERTRQWILAVFRKYGKDAGEINYIFCSDDYLLEMNQEYLDHDTYTDILTFDMTEEGENISADIFVSIDRVRENALTLAIDFEEELNRVIIHGILHLLGFDDKDEDSKLMMRQTEQTCLNILKDK